VGEEYGESELEDGDTEDEHENSDQIEDEDNF
jgi:hypothetical protein